jgi:hypothetical protein
LVSFACTVPTTDTGQPAEVEQPVEVEQPAEEPSPPAALEPDPKVNVAWSFAIHPPCPDDPARWAGEWHLNLLLWTHDMERDPVGLTAYELELEVVETSRFRATVRGPDPRTGRLVEGTAEWQRNCEWIGVNSMKLTNASGDHAELVFLLALVGDQLKGYYALYEQPFDPEGSHFSDYQGAAAARGRAPEFSEDLDGFPCELVCGIRTTVPFVGVSGQIAWMECNGLYMCEEECLGITDDEEDEEDEEDGK